MAPAARARQERAMLEARLAGVDAVLHNQDNREHDLLDSDDYYQFEGGLALVVRHLSGRAPAVYHNDHSRPETPRIRTLARRDRPRRPRPRGEPALDRRRHAPRLQGRRPRSPPRSITCSPSPRPRGPSTMRHFDALYDAYLGRRCGARLHGRAQPGGARRDQPPLSRGDRPRAVAPTPQQRPRGADAMGEP